MTTINNEFLNNSTSDYNIFLTIKNNLVNGELKINQLSSKNRSLLHRICANYGLEHYSTGNYANRIFVIKDNNHTYFSDNNVNNTTTTTTTTTTNDDYWYVYLNSLDKTINENRYNFENNLNDTNKKNEEEYEEYEEDKEDEEEDEDEEVDEDEEDEEDKEVENDSEYEETDCEEEKDTDTYSSSSGSVSSKYYSSSLVKKIDTHTKILRCLYVISMTNLVLNLFNILS